VTNPEKAGFRKKKKDYFFISNKRAKIPAFADLYFKPRARKACGEIRLARAGIFCPEWGQIFFTRCG